MIKNKMLRILAVALVLLFIMLPVFLTNVLVLPLRLIFHVPYEMMMRWKDFGRGITLAEYKHYAAKETKQALSLSYRL